ncbi:MAG TPA: exonuclease domain-containing protein [Candidatus Krumholzibacteria bacterium]|nr:exonuclease domain-containing protein [Candidatus Krumholzibacteria bacterium]HPD72175.1 exonuclease domain-containing protein [Candidatus Krumholzibacteria bacterium]HRY40893.1 exonuclease domain-containing protein [Candidatus Krumholzibacteria bacterium]
MPYNELNELRDLAHSFLLEVDRPVDTQLIARHLFGPQRHEMPEAQVVVRSLMESDPRFLRTHCRRWSARWAPHLQQDLARAAFAVVDLETTGSVIGVDEIMEIGLVRLEKGRIHQRFTTRLRTSRDIPPWVSRLTGLSDRDLAGAPTLEETGAQISELLAGAIFVAHDIRFDMPFLRWELTQRDHAFPCETGLCTLQLSRGLWPDLPSHSLGELAASLGLDHHNPHRAGDDALAAAGVLLQALEAARGLGRRTLGELMELDLAAAPGARQSAES